MLSNEHDLRVQEVGEVHGRGADHPGDQYRQPVRYSPQVFNLPIYLSIYISIYIYIHLSIYLSIYSSIYLSAIYPLQEQSGGRASVWVETRDAGRGGRGGQEDPDRV